MISSVVAIGLETIDQLILARMLFSAAPAKARDDVGKIAAGRLSAGEWADAFDAHWRRLVEADLLRPKASAKTGNPGKTFELSEEGRRRVCEFLQVEEIPPKLNWGKLQSDYLLPLAMNVRPATREAEQLKTAASLQRAVIVRSKGLAPAAGATVKQVLGALAWKLIDVECDADFTAENVIQQFVFRQKPVKKLTAARVAAAVAAAAVGARTSLLPELRLSVIRQWLLQAGGGEEAAGAPDLAAFAERVLNAARRLPVASRFGDNKVFISHVWRKLQADRALDGLALEAFKRRLVEANRDGLVRLSRADLVEAMTPADVEESATAYENATFHFIRL